MRGATHGSTKTWNSDLPIGANDKVRKELFYGYSSQLRHLPSIYGSFVRQSLKSDRSMAR